MGTQLRASLNALRGLAARVVTHFKVRTVVVIALWYLLSCATLFLNKHILDDFGTSPEFLGVVQMFSTAVYGGLKMASGFHNPSPIVFDRSFVRDMSVLGVFRVVTVLLGLVSLNFVPVSFTETVKSAAPFFTVVFAALLLRERTTPAVLLSLVPIVGGLALCSAHELRYHHIGFWAAMLSNCVESLQNVYSKRLLGSTYDPHRLQFYTSVAALALQAPVMLYFWSPQSNIGSISKTLAFLLLMDGVCYHLQSVTAFMVMQEISAVSQSVANTVKRALLIWLSVWHFGNPMTTLGVTGSAIVFLGVLAYQYAIYQKSRLENSPTEKAAQV